MFTFLFFLGNTLYVLSYSVRNMLWLRILTIIAGSLAIPYFLFQEPSDWAAIFWQAAYISVNVINLVDLVIRMRPVKLSAEEEKLKQAVFQDLDARQVQKLVKLATLKHAKKGDELLHFQEDVSKLRLITQGHAEISLKSKALTQLEINDFIGEMSFLSGRKASADVHASESLSYLEWQNNDLATFFTKAGNLSLFQGILSKNLVRKLSTQSLERVGALE